MHFVLAFFLVYVVVLSVGIAEKDPPVVGTVGYEREIELAP